jgi:hypothetical protein
MRVANRFALAALLVSGPGCSPTGVAQLWNSARQASRPPPPPQPLPSSLASPTTKTDERARMAWARRNLLDAYDRVGLRDPKWDDAARQFIEMSLSPLVGTWSDTPTDKRVTRGRAVLSLGCGDPLVIYLYAADLFSADSDSYEAVDQYKRSVEGMKHVPYPRAVARLAISGYHRDLRRLGRVPEQFWPLAPTELQWFRQSLTDGSYRPGEEVILTWQLMNGTGPDFVTRNKLEVSAALDATAWVPPWARLHFSGLKESCLAWDARGHEFAKYVTPEGWKGFKEHSVRASRDLVHAWELRKDRPEAAYEMISASVDAPEPGADARTWFDRAVAAQFDYWPAYDARLAYLQPRWGGSYEEMLEFAAECAQTGRFDTYVPLFALEAVESVDGDQRDKKGGGGGEPVYKTPATFRLLSQMLDGYLKEPSRSWERSRFESLYALVADKAGRHDIAFQHLKANDFRFDGDARRRLWDPSEDFVGRVSVEGRPGATDAQRGEAQREAYDTARAIASFTGALRKDSSPTSSRFLKHRLAALDVERRLDGGEWVAFLPADAQLAGWESRLGSFERAPDGALVATPGARGHLIASAARVGPDFELRGTYEFVAAKNSEAGIAFGHPGWAASDWVGYYIERRGESQIIYLTHGVWQPSGPPVRIPSSDRTRFVVRSWRGRLSAAFNGKIVAQNVPAPDGFVNDRDAQVGLGAYSHTPDSIRYRDVELRRLTSEPPPLPAN